MVELPPEFATLESVIGPLPEPVREAVLDDLSLVLKCDVQGAAARPADVQRLLDRYYGRAEGGQLVRRKESCVLGMRASMCSFVGHSSAFSEWWFVVDMVPQKGAGIKRR